MTKKECEDLIIEKLKEINEIHKQYNPNANYLSMYINERSKHISVVNEFYGCDFDYPVNHYIVGE